MELDVSKLKENEGMTVGFQFKEEFEPLLFAGEKIHFEKLLNVEGSATNVGSSILVEGRIRTKILLNCSRCLEPVEVDLDINIIEEYVKDNGEMHEKRDDDGDIEVHIFDGDIIEMGEQVTANIIVNIPMKILCSTSCKGICPKCGQNLNSGKCGCEREEIDPRLDKLKEWFKG